jgi:TRAP-type C4-dicarboxylate transport system permease large subunit
VAEVRLYDVIGTVMIMLIPMFAVLFLVIAWPQVTLFLPNLFPPDLLQ